MSNHSVVFEAPTPSSLSSQKSTPSKIMLSLVILIFLSEMIAMTILYFLDLPSYPAETLLDGLIMTLLILPGLYIFQLKPLSKQIQEREKADHALRESEKLLRNVLEMMPVGVWIIDASGKILHGNPASQEIWGGVRYVGMDHYGEYRAWWLDSGKPIAPEDWAAARAINRGETSLNEEIEIESFDGARKIILNSAKSIYDENHQITGAVVVNQDITTLKQAQQAIAHREKLFSTAMENLPVGVWLTDETGKINYGNQAGQQIWAGAQYVSIDQFGEYKGWWLDTGKPIEPEEWAVARAITKGETSLSEEIEIECLDGTHKIILNSAIPVRDEQGKILWAFVVNQDITERKHREQVLMQTNELLERFFSSISTHIAYMDRDFNFIRVNEAYAAAAGHSPNFFLGKNHFDLYPHPENEAIFREVVQTGKPFAVLQKPFEYAEFPELGVTYWDWSLQPVKGSAGDVQGVVLSLVNVTERKRAEIQLERQNEELLILSRAEHLQRELAEGLVRSTIALNTSLEPETVLASILEEIRRAVPFQGADIVLVEGNTFKVASYSGFEGYPNSRQIMDKSFQIDDFPVFVQICNSLRPVVIENTIAHPDWRIVPEMEWVRSYAAAPLVAEGRLIGIINLSSDAPGFFDQQTLERIDSFAPSASTALRNAQLYRAEETARHAAETLSATALDLTQSLELDQVLETLLSHIDSIIHANLTGVALLKDGTHLEARAALVEGHRVDVDQVLAFVLESESIPLLQRVLSTHKSIIVPDTSKSPEWIDIPVIKHIHSWLAVPLVAGDQVIGLVGVGKSEPGNFAQEHVRWTEALAGQAAMAIQNAWLFEQVRSSSEMLHSLAHKLVVVQEQERYSIARELHDEAGQALSSLKLSLVRLEQDRDCPPHIQNRLQELKNITDCLLEDIHRLAKELRPAVLDHLGLIAALEQLVRNLDSEQLSVQLKAVGFEGKRLPGDKETALYRIVQEALTNVVRHANASNVGILLEWSRGKIKAFVEDDGVGFAYDPTLVADRLGLIGMRERAEMFGGSLVVETSSGGGTAIIVEVPCRAFAPCRISRRTISGDRFITAKWIGRCSSP